MAFLRGLLGPSFSECRNAALDWNCGQKEFMVMLRRRPRLARAKDKDGNTLLHAAMIRGWRDAAESLLANGADVNARGAWDKTPLLEAVVSNSDSDGEKLVELLLSKNADPNARDDGGRTPLQRAAAFGHERMVGLLLAAKAEVNAKDNFGRTAISQSSSDSLWELLIAAGADASIHDATSNGMLERVRAMLKVHPDLVFVRDHHGRTPLHMAVSEEKCDLAKLLLASGADVNARDEEGRTPLHSVRNAKVLDFLAANGADVNAKTRTGMTLLHYTNNEDVAEALLSKGVDVNTKTSTGWTALDIQAYEGQGHEDMIELLRRHWGREYVQKPNNPYSSTCRRE